jgi:predicted NAD/FAD-dependent oxidoreductase
LQQDLERYVTVRSISALPRHLASSLQVAYRTRVTRLEPLAHQWRLVSESGAETGAFDTVIVAVTPRQAVPLLAHAPQLAVRAQSVELAPCWSTLVTFEHALELDIDAAFVKQSPLSWLARNASKPGRPKHESWVLHATPTWSQSHLEEAPEAIAEALLSALFEATGAAPVAPRYLCAHRWADAQAVKPLTDGCLWEPNGRLAVCGDWCYGSRIEGAFLSGMAAAGRVLGLAGRPLTHAAR